MFRARPQGVALFDLSSFGKLRVSGAGAEAAMEWCASSSVGDAATGRVLYVTDAIAHRCDKATA